MVAWVIISIILFGISLLIKKFLRKQSFIPEYRRLTDLNLLGTINGIGSTFYGKFRDDGVSNVKYIFICFIWLPVIPIACRRVSFSGFSDKIYKCTTTYKIYSKEKWSFLEILQIFLCYWGGTSSVFSILFFVLS